MRQIILALLSLSFFLSKHGFSQTQVDYLTGAANVGIPLYNLHGYTQEYPIGVNYHTGGIKVNDVSSDVGLGWNLTGVGAVTRSLQGLPDETRNGEYYTNALTGDVSFVEKENYGGYMRYNEQVLNTLPVNSVTTGDIDTRPDEFHVQAPGLDLKFMFGKRNDIAANQLDDYYQDPAICFPMQDVKINYSIMNGRITGFIIQNSEGYSYEFNQVQTVKIKTYCNDTNGTNEYNSSWYLTAIKNPHGKTEIQIDYVQNESESEVHYATQTSTRCVEGAFNLASYTFAGIVKLGSEIDQAPLTCDIAYVSKMTHVSWISTYSELLYFHYNNDRQDLTGDKMLDEIVYKTRKDPNLTPAIISKCKLTHGYFISGDLYSLLNPAPPQDKWRLRLESITFTGEDNTPISKPTSFEYEGLTLPIRNNPNQDHWGYYNYQMNFSLARRYKFLNTYDFKGGPSREAGGVGCRLIKVNLPDGGSESFEFEPHLADKIGTEEVTRYENVQPQQIQCLTQAIVGDAYLEANPNPVAINNALYDLGLGNHVGQETHSQIAGFSLDHEQDITINYSGYYEAYDLGYNVLPNNFPPYTECTIQLLNADQSLLKEWVLPEADPYSNGDFDISLPAGSYFVRPIIHFMNGPAHWSKILCTVKYHSFQNAVEKHFIQVGGNRIKKIVYDDGDGDHSNDIATNYQYFSGVLYNSLDNRMNVDLSMDFGCEVYLNHAIGGVQLEGETHLSGNINSIMRSDNGKKSPYLVNGSPIGYEKTMEYVGDWTIPAGYTLYRYDLSEIPVIGSRTGAFQDIKTWRLKALRSVEHYNQNGLPASTTVYEYSHRNGLGAFNVIGLSNPGTVISSSQHMSTLGIPADESAKIAAKAGLRLVISATGFFRNPTPVGVLSSIAGVVASLHAAYMAEANPTYFTFMDDAVVNYSSQQNNYIYYENEYFNLDNVVQTQYDNYSS
jgi:hypothetical protein